MRDTTTPGSLLEYLERPECGYELSVVKVVLKSAIENLAREFELTAESLERRAQHARVHSYCPPGPAEHYENQAKAFRAAAQLTRSRVHLPFEFQEVSFKAPDMVNAKSLPAKTVYMVNAKSLPAKTVFRYVSPIQGLEGEHIVEQQGKFAVNTLGRTHNIQGWLAIVVHEAK